MASEYFLYIKLGKLLAEKENYFWSKSNYKLYSKGHLKELTRHYNGHIREIAVLCLGLIRDVSALPELINRTNDWAEPVRKSARQSIERLLVSTNAAEFVKCLPHLIWLLECQRDDHSLFVFKVMDFLSSEENKYALLNGLSSPDKVVAERSLCMLVNKSLFPLDFIFEQAMLHPNPIVRMRATEYKLDSGCDNKENYIRVMLIDSFSPIKQLVLQYMINNMLRVPEDLCFRLLLDKNSLVRSRIHKLIANNQFDVVSFYLDVFNNSSNSVAKRRVALCALNEHRYGKIIEITENNLDSNFIGVYMTSLKIIAQNKGAAASGLLFESMSHPLIGIVKLSLNLIIKEKIVFNHIDVQRLLDKSPSPSHIPIYYSMARALNKWDNLILILENINKYDIDFTKIQINHWSENYNFSGIQPSHSQKIKLKTLVDKINIPLVNNKVVFFLD
ncbi:HEAT repeat domain-containing protein [Serratia sp. NA_13]|uniref:HEAT repeat domain-containing protein n=1 Tax=Serratia sp. NA_13 TaxID=3415658 RepID=UPI0040468CA7